MNDKSGANEDDELACVGLDESEGHIIRILLVKLVKFFSMLSHIICYGNDFW